MGRSRAYNKTDETQISHKRHITDDLYHEVGKHDSEEGMKSNSE